MKSLRLPTILSVVGGLLLSGCVPAKKQSAAVSGPLPTKSPRAPAGTIYTFFGAGAVPDDPGYQGGGSGVLLTQTQRDVFEAIQAPHAWNIQTDCSAVVLGMVDSGVDTSHPDLVANLHNIGTQGAPVYGRNFVEGVGSSNVMDDQGHGTHVAGLMAAVGDNGVGVTGVCWTAKVLTAKVTDANGDAFLSDVVDGLAWTIDQGASIVNISMGSYVPATTYSEHLRFEDSFAGVTAKAAQRGAIIVAAAGNAGANSNINRTYPANLSSSHVISVAMNREGTQSGSGQAWESLVIGSNYGGNTVHLSAPGDNVMSTLRQGSQSTYGRKTGTSMASPMVAGSLALMLSNIKDRGKTIAPLTLIDMFLNHLQVHTSTNISHPELNKPGKSLLSGAKLDLGNVMGAAAAY